jgi:hypothetical protein
MSRFGWERDATLLSTVTIVVVLVEVIVITVAVVVFVVVENCVTQLTRIRFTA